ncbi:MAG: mannose-6-phosphate isomerase, class I [Candidatus Marinimicrobia bacterium]|nr:mannose-6-phosphate isomerase, class I [Candidatus Neomarinimicrobiota bacterium]
MIPELPCRPYLLKNRIQHYDWGMRDEQALIPKLLNIKPETGKPYAELWIGAHPKAPSILLSKEGEYALDRVIEQYPEKFLGKQINNRFAGKLPFLLKVLSAGESLSIQTHPDKKTAELLHKNDPRHYPDDNHKPEIAIALDSLKALVGFRPIQEIVSVFKKYSNLTEFFDSASFHEIVENKGRKESEKLYSIFSTIMHKAQKYPEKLEQVCQALDSDFRNKKQLAEREALFIELYEKYGSDVGLIVIYLLNLINLQKGQGVFLKAGVPHAYLKGNIIECMANSDNVVRAGLTPKYKDIATLVDIVDYNAGLPEIQKPGDESDKRMDYQVPAPEFKISRYKLKSSEKIEFTHKHKLEILILITGRILIDTHHEKLVINKGQTILIPGCLSDYQFKGQMDSTFFRVTL